MNSFPPSGISPPATAPSLSLGIAIGQYLLNARNADLAALGDAISWAKFLPEPTLRSAIKAEFSRRDVRIEPLDSSELANRIRQDVFRSLPTDVDAILDVQINNAGYYEIGGGLGFTPYFNITARLVDTVNPGEVIDEFSYSGDYGESPGDPRYFAASQILVQKELASFKSNSNSIYLGLNDLFEHVAAKLVDDIVRVRDKSPRVD